MSSAIINQPIDEVTVFRMSPAVLRLPEEYQHQLGFWYVIQSLQMQDNVVMYGPPRNFSWTITSDPAVMRAVELRHPCDNCREARESAAQLLEADPAESIAFVQFTQEYLYPIDKVPTEFAVTGGLVNGDG